MLRRTLVSACAGAVFCLAAGTAGAAANFNGDVNTAINKGLDYLNSSGAYTGYPACPGMGEVRGLALLALLEKRATGNLNDPPQGYSGASAEDQTRMRKAVSCILADARTQSFEAYYYGNWLMGLAFYARTGGPDKGAADIPDSGALLGLVDAINKLTDGTIAAQTPQSYSFVQYRGMWGYTGIGGDSSTTQFAAAGLAGAKAYYIAKGDPGGRVAQINTTLGNARKAYTDFGSTAGSDNGSCDRIEETEKGFGYYYNNNPSLQQTSSGLWVQLLGGATVNDNSVQAYLRWVRNHYRWQDLDSMGNSWPTLSHWYYMWSAMKGLLTIQESGISPNPGNLGSASYGLLAPDADPNSGDALPGTCPVRQLHRAPLSVARNAVFGADPGSFYAAESPSVYFDFAATILSHQCADGRFACNGAPSSWGISYYETDWDRTSWALLVLQRATGGACADLNNNGICDSEEGGNEEAPGDMLCDSNLDGQVTYSDLREVYGIIASNYPVAVPVTPQNSWANYNSTGQSADTIDINDFWQCYAVSRGKLPILYEGGGT